MKKRIINKFAAVVLIICTVLGLSGCAFLSEVFSDLLGQFNYYEGSLREPSAWDDGLTSGSSKQIRMMQGDSLNLGKYLPSEMTEPVWESACDGVVSVSGTTAFANKPGRTELTVTDGSWVEKFIVTVDIAIRGTGYDFTTGIVDDEIHRVSTVYEANRIIDRAIAEHKRRITVDFSGITPSFDAGTDFYLEIELGNHTSVVLEYDPGRAYIADIVISYNRSAASYTVPQTKEYSYFNMPTANAIMRRNAGLNLSARSDDYEGFAINSVTETFPVYNSEELWWAVEHGYKPVFPKANTKAELIYERAKTVLREIVIDDMTNYEKALAIYEYLIDSVAYDYDTYYNPKSDEEERKNTCYYLEGVFEQGRAVCDGKSKAYVLMCGIEGVPCVRATGASLTGDVAHAWNYVEVDNYWYLVDTTDGDALFEKSSDIGRHVGYGVELLSYASFLKPVLSYRDEFEMTQTWGNITISTKNVEYKGTHMNTRLAGTEYDFHLEDSEEVLELFRLFGQGDIPDAFTFSFTIDDSSKISQYFYLTAVVIGVKHAREIFEVKNGRYSYYVAVYSNKSIKK